MAVLYLNGIAVEPISVTLSIKLPNWNISDFLNFLQHSWMHLKAGFSTTILSRYGNCGFVRVSVSVLVNWGTSWLLAKCLKVFTCFRNDDGSVYRLLHPGTLQKYGFSVECVRVCLNRSDEFEYALLQPSVNLNFNYFFLFLTKKYKRQLTHRTDVRFLTTMRSDVNF